MASGELVHWGCLTFGGAVAGLLPRSMSRCTDTGTGLRDARHPYPDNARVLSVRESDRELLSTPFRPAASVILSMRYPGREGVIMAGMVRSRWAAGFASVVALMVLAQAPAAVGAEPRVIEFRASDPHVSTSVGYGSDEARLPVATGARLLVVETDRAAVGEVDCRFGRINRLDSDVQVIWSAEEWNADSRHEIPLPKGVVSTESLYQLVCNSGARPNDAWDLGWSLAPVRSTASVSTVSEDPATRTFQQRQVVYGSSGEPQRVRPGDDIRVIADPGTWFVPAGGNDDTVYASLASSSSGIEIYDAVVSPDGSTISFSVPDTLPPSLFGDDDIRIAAGTNSRDSAGVYVSASWQTAVRIPSETASTTTVSIPRRIGLSSEQLRVDIRITDPAPQNTYVLVRVDGREVGSVYSSTTGQSRFTFRLPKLGRGIHSVTAEYVGGGDVLSSTSAPVRILIVR